jgi:hypothetical protein
MPKHKNSRLLVDFPNKCHKEIKLISDASSLSFPKVAVKAMRIGLAAIMAMDAEELREVMK